MSSHNSDDVNEDKVIGSKKRKRNLIQQQRTTAAAAALESKGDVPKQESPSVFSRISKWIHQQGGGNDDQDTVDGQSGVPVVEVEYIPKGGDDDFLSSIASPHSETDFLSSIGDDQAITSGEEFLSCDGERDEENFLSGISADEEEKSRSSDIGEAASGKLMTPAAKHTTSSGVVSALGGVLSIAAAASTPTTTLIVGNSPKDEPAPHNKEEKESSQSSANNSGVASVLGGMMSVATAAFPVISAFGNIHGDKKVKLASGEASTSTGVTSALKSMMNVASAAPAPDTSILFGMLQENQSKKRDSIEGIASALKSMSNIAVIAAASNDKDEILDQDNELRASDIILTRKQDKLSISQEKIAVVRKTIASINPVTEKNKMFASVTSVSTIVKKENFNDKKSDEDAVKAQQENVCDAVNAQSIIKKAAPYIPPASEKSKVANVIVTAVRKADEKMTQQGSVGNVTKAAAEGKKGVSSIALTIGNGTLNVGKSKEVDVISPVSGRKEKVNDKKSHEKSDTRKPVVETQRAAPTIIPTLEKSTVADVDPVSAIRKEKNNDMKYHGKSDLKKPAVETQRAAPTITPTVEKSAVANVDPVRKEKINYMKLQEKSDARKAPVETHTAAHTIIPVEKSTVADVDPVSATRKEKNNDMKSQDKSDVGKPLVETQRTAPIIIPTVEKSIVADVNPVIVTRKEKINNMKFHQKNDAEMQKAVPSITPTLAESKVHDVDSAAEKGKVNDNKSHWSVVVKPGASSHPTDTQKAVPSVKTTLVKGKVPDVDSVSLAEKEGGLQRRDVTKSSMEQQKAAPTLENSKVTAVDSISTEVTDKRSHQKSTVVQPSQKAFTSITPMPQKSEVADSINAARVEEVNDKKSQKENLSNAPKVRRKAVASITPTLESSNIDNANDKVTLLVCDQNEEEILFQRQENRKRKPTIIPLHHNMRKKRTCVELHQIYKQNIEFIHSTPPVPAKNDWTSLTVPEEKPVKKEPHLTKKYPVRTNKNSVKVSLVKIPVSKRKSTSKGTPVKKSAKKSLVHKDVTAKNKADRAIRPPKTLTVKRCVEKSTRLSKTIAEKGSIKPRGTYNTYSNAERYRIAKYASEHGISAVVREFRGQLKETTVRGFLKMYKHMVEIAEKENRKPQKILASKKRGRPSIHLSATERYTLVTKKNTNMPKLKPDDIVVNTHCPMCGYKAKNLVEHLKVHAEIRYFQCKECGREFKRQEAVKHHVFLHTGEKPYTCSVCGKANRRKQHNVEHMRIHTGELPYQCTKCKRNFRVSSHLRYHQKEQKCKKV